MVIIGDIYLKKTRGHGMRIASYGSNMSKERLIKSSAKSLYMHINIIIRRLS